ncbi:MAG: GNAT family N-acetyltransferase [Bacteroides sp.]
MTKFNIRKANLGDLEQISELEQMCFPASEAATKDILKKRLEKYSNCFYVLLVSEKIVSMVNGMVTDVPDLLDEMYGDESLHNVNGEWQMIFGVDTHPEYRNRGFATSVLNAFIDNARNEHRKGLVLTCKKNLICYYEKFGFVSEGRSDSVHGDAIWYQMRLRF